MMKRTYYALLVLVALTGCVKKEIPQTDVFAAKSTGTTAAVVYEILIDQAYPNSSYPTYHSKIKQAVIDAQTYFQTHTDTRYTIKFPAGKFIVQSPSPVPGIGEISLLDIDPGPTNLLIFQGTAAEGVNATILEFPLQDQTEIIAKNSKGLRFRTMQFSRKSTPTVTQGTVASVNNGNHSLVLNVPADFPRPIDLVDPDFCGGKYLKRYLLNGGLPIMDKDPSNEQIPFESVSRIGSTNQYRFFVKSAFTIGYTSGQLIGVKSKFGASAYRFTDCSDVTFDNVVWSGLARGVFQGDSHHITINNCKVRRIGIANGYSENFCMSTSAGGPQMGNEHDGTSSQFSCTGTAITPPGGGRTHHMVVTNCTFESMGDDAIAFFRVDYGSITGNTLNNSFVRGINLNTCYNICLGSDNDQSTDVKISSCWDPLLFQKSDEVLDEGNGQTSSQGCPYIAN